MIFRRKQTVPMELSDIIGLIRLRMQLNSGIEHVKLGKTIEITDRRPNLISSYKNMGEGVLHMRRSRGGDNGSGPPLKNKKKIGLSRSPKITILPSQHSMTFR